MTLNAFESINYWSSLPTSSKETRYLWICSGKNKKIEWKKRDSVRFFHDDRRLLTIFTEMYLIVKNLTVNTLEQSKLLLKLKFKIFDCFQKHQKRFRFTFLRIIYQFIFERGLQKAHQTLQEHLKKCIEENIDHLSEDEFRLFLKCTSFFDLDLSKLSQEKIKIVIHEAIKDTLLSQKALISLLKYAPHIELDQFEQLIKRINSKISLSHLTEKQIILVLKHKKNDINALPINLLTKLSNEFPSNYFSDLFPVTISKLNLNDFSSSAVLNIPFYLIDTKQWKELKLSHWPSQDTLKLIQKKELTFWGSELSNVNTSQWPLNEIINVLLAINPVNENSRKNNPTICCRDWTASLFFNLEKEIDSLNLHLESFYKIPEYIDFSQWSKAEIDRFLSKHDIENCDVSVIEKAIDKISNLKLKKLSFKQLKKINYDHLSQEQITKLLKLTTPPFWSNHSIERNAPKIDKEFFIHLTPKALELICLNNLAVEQILNLNPTNLSNFQLAKLDLDRFSSNQVAEICRKLKKRIRFINPETLVKNLNKFPIVYYAWINSKKQLGKIDFSTLSKEQIKFFEYRQTKQMLNFKENSFKFQKRKKKAATHNFKKCLTDTLEIVQKNQSEHKHPLYEQVKTAIFKNGLKTKVDDLGLFDRQKQLILPKKKILSIFHPDKNPENTKEAEELFKIVFEAIKT